MKPMTPDELKYTERLENAIKRGQELLKRASSASPDYGVLQILQQAAQKHLDLKKSGLVEAVQFLKHWWSADYKNAPDDYQLASFITDKLGGPAKILDGLRFTVGDLRRLQKALSAVEAKTDIAKGER